MLYWWALTLDVLETRVQDFFDTMQFGAPEISRLVEAVVNMRS